jgi:tRNA/rRNA methyltransferase
MMKARAEAADRAKPKTQAMPKSRAKAAPSSLAPAVILIAPQLGENIGFAARAMANFGLNELRLVAPRDGWPNEKARAAAAGADSIIDGAKVYESLAEAIGDLTFLLATTARPRGMVKPVLTPAGAARELAARGAKGERAGVMFGPERSGLDNDAISLADAIVTAPVNPSFASLSLPQTVLLIGYEWRQARMPEHSLGRATPCDGPAAEGLDLPARVPRPAPNCSPFSSTWKASSTDAVSCARLRNAPPWCAPSATCFIAWARPSRTSAPGAGSWLRSAVATDASARGKGHSSAPFLLLR